MGTDKDTRAKERRSMRKSKKSEVLRHLQEKGSITSLQAIELYGATRLSGIIFKLKKEGYNIITRYDNDTLDKYGNRCSFANYVLVEPKAATTA